MNKEVKKVLKVEASCLICNNASLNIYDIEYDIDNCVIAGLNSDTPRKYKLYDTNKGTYFNYGKTRYYLSEFMRTN